MFEPVSRFCEDNSYDNTSIPESKRRAIENARLDCRNSKFKPLLEDCTNNFIKDKDLDSFVLCRKTAHLKVVEICKNANVEKFMNLVL